MVLSTTVFQSAVAHELFSDNKPKVNLRVLFAQFQSAVAHELFSDPYAMNQNEMDMDGFKALSRMSSSPTSASRSALRGRNASFKALSRMSSSPTLMIFPVRTQQVEFQSAVAHELFSD